MALVKCKECGKKISNKAEVCIGCGYPLSKHKKNSSVDIKAFQRTKKTIKLQLLLSKFLMGIELMILLFLIPLSDRSSPLVGHNINIKMYAYISVFMLIFGTILYIIAKVRIWWNHE